MNHCENICPLPAISISYLLFQVHHKVTDMRHSPKGCVVSSRHINSCLTMASLSLCHPLCQPCEVLTVLQELSPGSLHLWAYLSLNSGFMGRIEQSSLPAWPFRKGKHKSYVSYSSSRWEHGACCNGFEPFSILSCRFLLPKSYYNKIPQLTAKALSFSVLVLQLWLSALLSLFVTPGTS